MKTTKRTATSLTLAATVVLGVGVLSACGSPSASESPSPSSSETTSRDAGRFSKNVKLTVINETGGNIALTQTSSERRPTSLKGSQDEYVVVQSTSYQVPDGRSSDYAFDAPGAVIKSSSDKNPDSFTFINPDIGKPYMRYANGPSTSKSSSYKEFSEDQSYTWNSPTSGRTYVIKRGEDTNTKVFTIIVK